MNIVLMLIGVVVVYKILSVVYKENWDKNLSSDVSFSNKTATKGDKIDIIETVVNAKKLPVFCMNVKFDIDRSFIFGQNDTNSMVSDKTYRNDVFSLLSNQKVTRRIAVECSRRGVFRLSAVEMVFPGAFMNEIMIHRSRLYSDITVFPKPADVKSLTDVNNMIMGELERRKYLSEDKFVFAGIRDYQSYDSVRDINWKAYARTGNLMVNHYNVSLISNGRDIDTKQNTRIEAGSGLSHFNQINTKLARIDISQDMEEFAQLMTSLNEECTMMAYAGSSRSDMIYVIISANKNDRIRKAAGSIMNNQNNKIWIVPRVNSGIGSMYYENV